MKMHTDTDAHDCSHDSESESTYEPSEYWPESDALKELTKRGSDTNARNYCHDSDSESTYEPSEYYSESDALLELTKRGSGGIHPTRTNADDYSDDLARDDKPPTPIDTKKRGRPRAVIEAATAGHIGKQLKANRVFNVNPYNSQELTTTLTQPVHLHGVQVSIARISKNSTGAAQDSASAGTALVFCQGSGEEKGGCPNWAQVTASRGKCKSCRSTEKPPRPTPPTSTQQHQTPSQAKRNTTYLEAACRVELLLAHRPPPAHCPEGTFGALLWRLCVTADTDMVPGELRKFASHCGGVPPSAKLQAFTDTPMLADPGNHCYAAVVARLLRHVAKHEPEAYVSLPHWGAQMLHKMGEEKVGDVCEAVLAAANAAADREQGRSHRWETLRGGAAPAADASVPLLVRLISWQTMGQ